MTLRFEGLAGLEKAYRSAARKTGQAEATAVRRAGVTVRARQARAIGKIVNVKIGKIKDALRVVKKPTAADPRIVFEVKGLGISLIEFSARQGKRGAVTVRVLRKGGRKVVHAPPGMGAPFIARGYGGNRQVFVRIKGRKKRMTQGRYAGKMREPLAKLYGPDIYSQYIKDEIQRVGSDTWNERLQVELDRAVAHAMEGIFA